MTSSVLFYVVNDLFDGFIIIFWSKMVKV